ncbi:hypothetical protein [Moorena bouillonii]|uniref:Uncharacterized protein n=1 Tax=Moorena bouillonii PNG TaxID=568701 RepID=A0A1U7N2I9_9CYAN|nr:hypothetical protein [Moorena bouillonii]OLT60177.1 hypothetical protein BJP37_15250 [Moorena bouillonii PNG]
MSKISETYAAWCFRLKLLKTDFKSRNQLPDDGYRVLSNTPGSEEPIVLTLAQVFNNQISLFPYTRGSIE